MTDASRASSALTPDTPVDAFIDHLKRVVGDKHVLTKDAATRRYRTGFRFGTGPVTAVVRPGSLVEQWRILKACIDTDRIVITQAANTGLTGGSTPDGNDYDREIVIINTLRLAHIQLIDEGRQALCLPGATLDQLEKALAPLGREPHSVIGSSCLGASVFGGVCNNSGGSLVKRGPAYTELALYARVREDGALELVNHLGITLGQGEPETLLERVERGEFRPDDIELDRGVASDPDYQDHVRDIDADTPARFNNDPRRLYEASGSAGKLMVFALRLDTFPMEKNTQVFYLGTNDPDQLTELRRTVLREFDTLPVAGEYMHRDAYDIAERYGKDTFLTIARFGTHRLPTLFKWKSTLDSLAGRVPGLPENLSDHVLQRLGRFFPAHLPARMTEYRNRFEHHLLLKVSEESLEQTRRTLAHLFDGTQGAYFECTPEEGKKAFLHRFAAAGAAVRYRIIHSEDVEDIVALDIALKRNERQWLEQLPEAIDRPLIHKLYYGHFFCHVMHQDYIVAKGTDCLALEHEMWKLLDARGAEYPAEHNVGHLYTAKPALKSFYRDLDPCNCFNPGIGQTSKHRGWKEDASAPRAPST
ncbi:D-lactate dehydrogenase [Larsenimonas salina]|uniref:D-lactate dehydrogenase n=1 Tax=Larsenimonas salina TaxID=1295565 RepID=UPI00207459D7|nr:D-lactate dehydrogenase [Larsenimonas salina]MCM5704919.1 D-lactate dehydrogenase [Larsenimonas salina]